ncbi:MAG: serine O-acetyltransferase EpsC [Chthoniobacterales bacterium]
MEETLQKVTREILTSYSQIGGLNNADGPNMPSKAALDSVCIDLLRLLFPGFHDEGAVHGDELTELTRWRLASISERLEDLICKSQRVTDADCSREIAKEILRKFLTILPGIREVLKTDIEAAYEGDPAASSSEEIILSYPSIEAIAIQRLAHIFYRSKVPLLPRMMTEWVHSRTGIDIHPGAQIGQYFFIDHGTGVVIGETCVIGDHVKLYHGVTLGAKSFQRDSEGAIVKGGKRHPNVENNVTIYPNSTILGGETVIGESSTIGANVFLMQSVEARSLVFYEEKQLRILAKRDKPNTQEKNSYEAFGWSI